MAAFPSFSFFAHSARAAGTERRAETFEPHEIARERRAFVDEMLCASPDAFSSELDVQMMLSQFPRGF